MSTRTILVTGGTGTVGRPVVEHLLAAGHDVRIASRRPPPAVPNRCTWATVDYRSSAGLAAAVGDAHTVVHCARSFRARMDRALITAARRAGVAHLVYISIVGVDRIPLGYYRTKLDAEQLIARCGLGWTVLRTTQFHDLLLSALTALARAPVVPLPAGVRFQPVDAREVAGRLAELAAGPPAGRVADMGGPEVRGVDDLARAYLLAAGRRRPVLPVWLPGRVSAGFRRGLHLTPDRAIGARTFEQFLDERIPPAAAPDAR